MIQCAEAVYTCPAARALSYPINEDDSVCYRHGNLRKTCVILSVPDQNRLILRLVNASNKVSSVRVSKLAGSSVCG